MASKIIAYSERSGIYQIQNDVSGKRYIGSAVCIRQRWNEHKSMLRRGKHHCQHLQNSWNKNNPKDFTFSILFLCPTEHLIELEQHFIDTLKPEFNACRTAGNTSGRKHSEETKEKIRKKAIGRKFPDRSEEYRQKLSAAHKGRSKPTHVIQALQKGRSKQTYTDARKAKVSKSLRESYENGLRSRKKNSDHRNKISKTLSRLTENDVREIRSLSAEGVTGVELSKRYKTPRSTISQIVKRKRYRWVS